jgi:hypothetical protein
MSKKTIDESADIATAELVQTLLDQINVMDKAIKELESQIAGMDKNIEYSMPELDIDIE